MARDGIVPPLGADHQLDGDVTALKRTLGNIRLRHHETGKIILIPTPSSDPNDPLNWPQWYKYYIATVVCIAMMMCNFLSAGPSIAIVNMTMEFFPGADPQADPQLFSTSVAKVAYFFSTLALLQGVGNFFWIPIANKYGRRSTYVFSYVIYFATALWLNFEHSYGAFLAGRIIMGFGAGAAETVAPITIADIFFLHERGTVMAFYTSFLAIGASLGIIISGLITLNHHWRVIFQVSAALIGLVLLLIFFTLPETAYIRVPPQASDDESSPSSTEKVGASVTVTERPFHPLSARTTYLESLKLFPDKALTTESLLKLVIRPVGLICLPPVLWAALVEAGTIGFLVAVGSNVDVAFATTYQFKSWQTALCFVAAVVGSVAGIPAGGQLGDKVADWLTRRNGGVRDPEMRLPAMIPSLIAAPLSLILFGVGIEHKLHWICPTIGIGLLMFAIVQGTNVALVYVIDAYRPVAGEVTLAVMGFKSLFGFLFSFYTNTWVTESGYQTAYGIMAAISASVLLLWIPLYFWGKKIRRDTWQWPVVSYIHWSDDREVGE